MAGTEGNRTGKYLLEIEAQYTGLVVRPGDRLVLAFPGRMNMQNANELSEYLERLLPGVIIVPIEGVSGMAVFRDEPLLARGDQEVVARRPDGSFPDDKRPEYCLACGSSGEPLRGCQNLWHVEART